MGGYACRSDASRDRAELRTDCHNTQCASLAYAATHTTDAAIASRAADPACGIGSAPRSAACRPRTPARQGSAVAVGSRRVESTVRARCSALARTLRVLVAA